LNKVTIVRWCQILRTLNVQSLLQIGRSQLHWFGHVTRSLRRSWRVKFFWPCWLYRESDPDVNPGPGCATASLDVGASRNVKCSLWTVSYFESS